VTEELYSVDQVAAQLGLHVRTVRNYVRSGRLKAVRIGKQYRIAREHLNALTGQPPAAPRSESGALRHVEVSSIVQVEAIDVDSASRLTNALMAAARGPRDADQPLRIDTIYDRERSRMKVILTGSIATTVSLLRFITVYVES
jgi:excisionase family DNA binding protein